MPNFLIRRDRYCVSHSKIGTRRMEDPSFVDRISGPSVIDHRKPSPRRLAYWRFQQAALESKTPTTYGPHGSRPDPGPFWRQPLAVCLVIYAFVLMLLAVML
jgi:hypothetical protein